MSNQNNKNSLTAGFNYATRQAQIERQATIALGSWRLAEVWLSSPCSALHMQVPKDLIKTAEGFDVVVETLKSVKPGDLILPKGGEF